MSIQLDDIIFNIGDWYNSDTKEFHITKDDAADMIRRLLETFKDKLVKEIIKNKLSFTRECFLTMMNVQDSPKWQ